MARGRLYGHSDRTPALSQGWFRMGNPESKIVPAAMASVIAMAALAVWSSLAGFSAFA
ncbi:MULTISPECIES: hypothetical protein [unclassified Novosphingobium]|uniref:hypothetical protein n=1 Tax=unclassified Novosphingobium TaxID=2644732 RepID=UPI001404481E|nr:hypothetical protein [Novosphingobium sp. PhB57]